MNAPLWCCVCVCVCVRFSVRRTAGRGKRSQPGQGRVAGRRAARRLGRRPGRGARGRERQGGRVQRRRARTADQDIRDRQQGRGQPDPRLDSREFSGPVDITICLSVRDHRPRPTSESRTVTRALPVSAVLQNVRPEVFTRALAVNAFSKDFAFSHFLVSGRPVRSFPKRHLRFLG